MCVGQVADPHWKAKSPVARYVHGINHGYGFVASVPIDAHSDSLPAITEQNVPDITFISVSSASKSCRLYRRDMHGEERLKYELICTASYIAPTVISPTDTPALNNGNISLDPIQKVLKVKLGVDGMKSLFCS